jgi:hypothetical protein
VTTAGLVASMPLTKSLRLWLPALAVLAAVIWIWPRRTRPPIEEPVAPTAEPPGETLPAAPPAPPRPDEVQAKVGVIFGAVAQWDGAPGSFAAGDFNGDGAADLAVVLRPQADRLAALNSEVANWIQQDPVVAAATPPGNVPPRPQLGGDPFLAVMHGYGASGWRNPEAHQTYVLKSAAGTALEARPLRPLLEAAGVRLLREPTGDGLVEELASQRGFLYWKGARYVWSPLRGGGGRS